MWTSNQNSQVFQRLLAEAPKAERVGSSKHSAALVYRGKVVAIGHNKLKSHPMMLRYHKPGQVYLHAEVDAIIKAVNKYGLDFVAECDLYCLRIKARSGQVGNSKPCNGCADLIRSFNIKGVYWT